MLNWGFAGSSSPWTETANKEKTCAPKLDLPLEPEKKNKMKDSKVIILAGLRHLLAIFSSQISTTKQPIGDNKSTHVIHVKSSIVYC